MGAAWYVVDLVVVILGYCDGIWSFAHVRCARRGLLIVSPQHELSGREGRKSEWHRGGGSERPRQKHAARAFGLLGLFLKSLIQTLVKTIGRSENAFVPANSYDIEHSVEQCGAVATLSKVPVKRRPLRGT